MVYSKIRVRVRQNNEKNKSVFAFEAIKKNCKCGSVLMVYKFLDSYGDTVCQCRQMILYADEMFRFVCFLDPVVHVILYYRNGHHNLY